LRYKHGIAANPTAAGFVSAQVAAERLEVSTSVLLDWFRTKHYPPTGGAKSPLVSRCE